MVVTRTTRVLLPDSRRVIAKPYLPGEEIAVDGDSRLGRIGITRERADVPRLDQRPRRRVAQAVSEKIRRQVSVPGAVAENEAGTQVQHAWRDGCQDWSRIYFTNHRCK